MRIYYIRHAESHNNHMYFVHQSSQDRLVDPPLSAVGEQQAAELTAFLAENKAEFAFDRIFVSPFLRTLQTAQSFAHLYPGIPKTVWMWIHEGGGCFEIESEEPFVTLGDPGMTRSEIKAQFPGFEVSEEITDEGWYFLPEMEAHSHRSYRAFHVVDHLIREYGDSQEKIALVSHGGFHNHFTNAILQRTRQPNLWLEIENTAISCFRFKPDPVSEYHRGRWTIDYMNRHEWLHGKDLKRDWPIYN